MLVLFVLTDGSLGWWLKRSLRCFFSCNNDTRRYLLSVFATRMVAAADKHGSICFLFESESPTKAQMGDDGGIYCKPRDIEYCGE